ncbi:DUF2000 domain-containing protein [Microbacterium sp. K41]|uniref:DUF2000 domain-containing protein n=1 Tax=Microbacterium sp. K41 TaxID=2305437 RepID=UPI00109C6C5C|nr:DUF2000 domain-containing protein [Microbacterium sp. K41]
MEPQTVRFDTRIAVLIHDDLMPWQELNVTAFLISGIATSAPGLIGDIYADADGNEYLPMLRQPVLVFTADSEQLARARERAIERGFATSIYTRDLFATGDDASNRRAVAGVSAADLDLVGVALRGPKNPIDRITKGLGRHI